MAGTLIFGRGYPENDAAKGLITGSRHDGGCNEDEDGLDDERALGVRVVDRINTANEANKLH